MSASAHRPYRQVARARAAGRLREAIIDAFFTALMTEWLDDITLDTVAARADTTRQTVIRLFGGKEGLLVEALERLHASIDARCCWPEGETTAALAHRVVAIREVSGDLVMRLIAQEPRHKALRAALVEAKRSHGVELTEALEPRLRGASAARRAMVFAQFRTITDTFTWAVLRRDLGLSAAETERVIADMLDKAMTEDGTTGKNGDPTS